MAIPSQVKLERVEWDMTPMIDMVFLLIVFFSLVFNFSAADQNERIKLPISELAQPPELPPTEPITLHILTDGKVIYNEREQVPLELQNSLTDHLRDLKFMNVPLEKVTVIIRADARCESGKVFDVVELCQNFGLDRIVFRIKQQEE